MSPEMSALLATAAIGFPLVCIAVWFIDCFCFNRHKYQQWWKGRKVRKENRILLRSQATKGL